MPLSSLKTKNKLKATKKFTDRDAPREVFNNSLADYIDGEPSLKVLVYYGVGGIGKTSLLNHLKKECSKLCEHELDVVFVNLESSVLDSPASCLYAIYNQLSFSCPAFEFALAKLWAIQGRTIEDIKKQRVKQDSMLYDVLSSASDIAEVFAPVKLVNRLIDKGSDLVNKWWKKDKFLIEDIENMDEHELEENLPYFLAHNVETAVENGKKLIFFFDSHETVIKRDNFRNTKQAGDKWLRDFIGSTECGLYIIAGREYLKWGDEDKDWNSYIEQHILGELSNEDAEYFLKHIPIDDTKIRSAIIATSQGVPLYLDLCASIYFMQKQKGDVLPDDFSIAQTDVVKRFLSHLDSNEQETLKVCALLEQYDQELVAELTKELNISFPTTKFKDFTENSYSVELNHLIGSFKIHDIVTNFIKENTNQHVYYEVTVALLKYCWNLYNQQKSDRLCWIYPQLIVLTLKVNTSKNKEFSDRLLTIGLYLIDVGFWKSLSDKLDSYNKEDKAGTWLHELLFIKALCLRKNGKLKEAYETYEETLARVSKNVEWLPLLEFHAAHNSHLMGRYCQALNKYESLTTISQSNPYSAQVLLLARRQASDIYMLHGRFVDALSLFSELSQHETDEHWLAEINRFKGHVYRFNFHLRDAIKQYKVALDRAERLGSDAMRAKVLTNLTEAYCWIEPSVAIEYGEKAIELNRLVNAPIEVGKALAATSIAMTLFGKSRQDAANYALQAEKIQKKAGYKSGVLFALQAYAIHLIKNGELEDSRQVVQTMLSLSMSINSVYRYISLFTSYLTEGKWDLENVLLRDFQWLNLDKTKSFLHDLRNSLI